MTLLCCEFFDILDVSKYKIHDMTIDILKNPCTYYESLEKLHFFSFFFFLVLKFLKIFWISWILTLYLYIMPGNLI